MNVFNLRNYTEAAGIIGNQKFKALKESLRPVLSADELVEGEEYIMFYPGTVYGEIQKVKLVSKHHSRKSKNVLGDPTQYCFHNEYNGFSVVESDDLDVEMIKYVPLFKLCDKFVYKGDVLYVTYRKQIGTVEGISTDDQESEVAEVAIALESGGVIYVEEEDLRWEVPEEQSTTKVINGVEVPIPANKKSFSPDKTYYITNLTSPNNPQPITSNPLNGYLEGLFDLGLVHDEESAARTHAYALLSFFTDSYMKTPRVSEVLSDHVQRVFKDMKSILNEWNSDPYKKLFDWKNTLY